MKSINIENVLINNLRERLKILEDKVFSKSDKNETTRAQQMLLLKHSGILEFMSSLNMKKKETARFLSILLNRSSDNIEDDLTNILSSNSPIATKKNYQFLIETFSKTGLDRQKKEAEKILEQLDRKG